MIRARPLLALAMAGLVLSGCADGRQRMQRTAIDRALSSAQYAAQPSLIVARESEFARAAREDGQWTAFRRFASGDALLHGRNGPVPARRVLATLDDPAAPVQWSPRTVVMSCDGRLAVSTGRFREPEGYVGNFVTVWERDRYDDDYEWSYDVAGRDDPQPTPVEPVEGEIVATAFDAVQGRVADCPRGGEPVPAPPAVTTPADVRSGEQVSADGTLRWRWEHRADGTKHVRVDYYTSGAWEKIIDKALASPPE
ncbi:hypothetical protein [Alteriqipengyuania sp. 357]